MFSENLNSTPIPKTEEGQVEPDASSLLRIIGLLFIPLACFAQIGRWLGQDWTNPHYWPLTHFFILGYMPFWDQWAAHFYLGCLTLLGLLLLFHLCPCRYRKAYLALAATCYYPFLLGIGYFLQYAVALAVLWTACRWCRDLGKKAALVLLGTGIVIAAAWRQDDHWLRYLAVYNALLYCLRAYSINVDIVQSSETLSLPDYLLFMMAGFPCWLARFGSFTYVGFKNSFLRRPYKLIASRGLTLIYIGVAQTAAAAAMEYWFFHRPTGAIPLNYADPNVSVLRLWLAGIGCLALDLIRFMAGNTLLVGLNALFGFDLPENYNRPWLASSPLDYCRRVQVYFYQYRMKYVYFPIYKLSRSLETAVFSVFVLGALGGDIIFSAIMRRPEEKIVLPVSAISLAVLCTAEAYLYKRNRTNVFKSTDLSSQPALGMLKIAGTWLLILLVRAPLPSFFDVANPIQQAPHLWERYTLLYERLFFIK